MKLVLAGGYDTSNLGDHAMLHILRTSLDKYGKTNITLLSRHLEKEIEKDYHVKLIKNLDHETKQKSIGRWFNGFNLNDDTQHIQNITKELQESDVLIIGGGRLLIDLCLDFMKGPLPYFMLLVIVAKFLNIPVVIYAMTIVAPNTELGQNMLKFIIENATLVMVREDSSKITLENLKISNNNLHVIPDPAFALSKDINPNLIDTIFKRENLIVNKSYIGINLRYTNLDYSVGDKEFYYKKLAKFCDLVYEYYKKDILLISQMNYATDNIYDDDRNLYKLVKQQSLYKKNIHIFQKKYNIFETLVIYGHIEMLFSMRRHGLIFAATQNTPVYGLVAEKNTQYALKEMGLEKNTIDICTNFTSNMFDNLLSTLETKNILSKNIPPIAKNVQNYAQEIYNLVKTRVKHV